ncbi:unnamed protein product [Bemisia tabaci]|uniref:Receptor ligand binding region domain-containing protein n=1 Tax=Bemisia tabaci TaxID=7038 RepID=A0A9P0CDV8_BEMTA|nr:unnamed protein product [Bemisia tabaci]
MVGKEHRSTEKLAETVVMRDLIHVELRVSRKRAVQIPPNECEIKTSTVRRNNHSKRNKNERFPLSPPSGSGEIRGCPSSRSNLHLAEGKQRVIIFGSDQEVAGVMKAVRRLNVTGWFSWVGSDGWSARALVSNGNEKEVEGTLSVQPQANPVKGFEEYFLNLTVENNKRNPWFVEFWEAHFTCRYPNSSLTPYNGNYTRTCTMTEKLTAATTAFEKQLQFVSDAVMAFAHAFKDMHRDLCHNETGLCEAMNPSAGPELLKYLRNVSFIGLSGDHFRFDSNGDGPARYNIIHYKRTSDTVYEWVKVGEYIDGELDLNMSEIRFSNGQSGVPESVCSLPCELGEAKKYVERESCCWHCFNCSQYQVTGLGCAVLFDESNDLPFKPTEEDRLSGCQRLIDPLPCLKWGCIDRR